jgi:hypothetical protein
MQVVDFHQILKVLMTMKQDQAESILVTLYMVTSIVLQKLTIYLHIDSFKNIDT